jgi:predicted  nucleic acid-binding Zn-ribbon protein
VLPDTTPPDLVLSSPVDDAEIDINAVTVSGTTEPGSDIDVNGVRATVKDDGSFSLDLFLIPGENTIVVTSTDASGNHAVETRTVTFTDPREDEIASLTDDLEDLSAFYASLLGNISLIENQIASIFDEMNDIRENITSVRETMGAMNNSDNSSIIDELEALFIDLDMAKENLTSLKERLLAIEGKGNETVDLSGIMSLIEDLEENIDGKEAEISTLKTDVSSLKSDVDSLKGSDPEKEDWRDDIDRLEILMTLLGVVVLVSMLVGIFLFVIMFGIALKKKRNHPEE